MGFMDFLRKKSDSGLGSDASSFDIGKMEADTMSPSTTQGMDFGKEHNLNPSSMDYSSMNSNSFGQSSMQQPVPQGQDLSRDIQMISLKLDAIKSEMDAISQRLKNLESIAEREQLKTTKKWY